MYNKLPLLSAFMLALLFGFPVNQANAGSCGYQRCWGAVGFGPYGARAFSHGYGSERQAWRRTNQECGGNCTTIKTFYNTCGAIASGPDNGWGWGYAPNRRRSERLALQYCRQNSYDCRIQAWACSK